MGWDGRMGGWMDGSGGWKSRDERRNTNATMTMKLDERRKALIMKLLRITTTATLQEKDILPELLPRE